MQKPCTSKLPAKHHLTTAQETAKGHPFIFEALLKEKQNARLKEPSQANKAPQKKNLPDKATMKHKQTKPSMEMSTRQRRSHQRAARPQGTIEAQYGPTHLSY
jgi:hypothetical protein